MSQESLGLGLGLGETTAGHHMLDPKCTARVSKLRFLAPHMLPWKKPVGSLSSLGKSVGHTPLAVAAAPFFSLQLLLRFTNWPVFPSGTPDQSRSTARPARAFGGRAHCGSHPRSLHKCPGSVAKSMAMPGETVTTRPCPYSKLKRMLWQRVVKIYISCQPRIVAFVLQFEQNLLYRNGAVLAE